MKVGQAELLVQRGGRDQHDADRDDADGRQLAAATELRMRHAARNRLFLQGAVLGQAQHDIGQHDRGRRGQGEQAQPFGERAACARRTTTRLAGLEIGSTKLAALAMKAQTNR